MKGISKVKALVVEKITDGTVLHSDVIPWELRQKLTQVVPLGV
jgi:hypothetical protein